MSESNAVLTGNGMTIEFAKGFKRITGAPFKGITCNPASSTRDMSFYWDLILPNGRYELEYTFDTDVYTLRALERLK